MYDDEEKILENHGNIDVQPQVATLETKVARMQLKGLLLCEQFGNYDVSRLPRSTSCSCMKHSRMLKYL